MTLFALRDLHNWQQRLLSAATEMGAHAARKGPGCHLWWPQERQGVPGKPLEYVEGVRLTRQWLGHGPTALAIAPQRLYFEHSTPEPSAIPEWKLVGEQRPPLPPPHERITQCLEWAQRLATCVPGFCPTPLPVARTRTGLAQITTMEFGNGSTLPAGTRMGPSLQRHGFFRVPPGFHVLMAAPEQGIGVAQLYKNYLHNAMNRCRVQGGISLNTWQTLSQQLADTSYRSPAGHVVLMAVTGHKGNDLPEEAKALLKCMMDRDVPFRMFSLGNPSLNWAALDQLGSLLSGAGGTPYVEHLPWPDDLEQPFLLGVDLGHPLGKRISRVVLSLLDEHGVHVGSWRQTQDRDETIRPRVLAEGLRWARKRAEQLSGMPDAPFLVLRDGRLHLGESMETYVRLLGGKVSFVEFAKYDNPLMFVGGPRPQPAAGGSECIPAGSNVRFITPVSPRLAGDLSRSFKLHMPPRWDGLKLGMDRLSEIVTGLSYSPALGLAPHALPGPVYWANGIAAIGEANHQFAGQRIKEFRKTGSTPASYLQ